MSDASKITAGGGSITLSMDDRTTAALRSVQMKFQAFGAVVRNIGLGMTAAGAAIKGALTYAATSFAEKGAALYDMSKRTGVAAETLSQFGYAAERAGASSEDLEKGIKKMQVFMGKAAARSEETAASLAELGISAADLSRMSPDEAMLAFADGIDRIANPSLRAAKAVEIFGRNGTMLLPMFQGGAEGLREMMAEADAFGLTASTKGVKSAKDLSEAMHLFHRTLGKVVSTIGSVVAPAFTTMFRTAAQWLAATSKFIKENKGIVLAVASVGSALLAAGAAFTAAGIGISLLGQGLLMLSGPLRLLGGVVGLLGTPVTAAVRALGAALMTGVVVALKSVGAAAVFLFTTFPGALILVAAGFVALTAYLIDFRTIFGQVFAYFGELWKWLTDTALSAWGGIRDAIAAGDLALAGKVAMAGLYAVWVKAAGEARVIWSRVTGFFQSIWSDAVHTLAGTMLELWYGMRKGWASTIAVFSDLWIGFTSWIKESWNTITTLFQKGVNYISLTGDELVNANKMLDVQREASSQEIARRRDEDAAANAKSYQEQMATILSEQMGARSGIADSQLAEERRIDDETRKARADAEKAVADAQRDLQSAIQSAKAAKEAAMPRAIVGNLGDGEELGDQVARSAKQSVVGSFNAAAIGRVVGASREETRTANATEETARNTRRLVDAFLRNPGSRFGG